MSTADRNRIRDLSGPYVRWSTQKLPTTTYLRAKRLATTMRQQGRKWYGAGWAILDAIEAGLNVMENKVGLLPWEHTEKLRSLQAAEVLRVAKEATLAAARKENDLVRVEALERMGYADEEIVTKSLRQRVTNMSQRVRRGRKKEGRG